MVRRAALAFALALVACSAPTAPHTPSPRPSETAGGAAAIPTPTPRPSAECPAGFAIVGGGRARVTFTERLELINVEHTGSIATSDHEGANIRLPPDEKPLWGAFRVADADRLDPCSAVFVNLQTLRSEDDPFANIPGAPSIEHRDETIRDVSLRTSRHPTAAFRPRTYEGVPHPMPPAGEWRVTIAGQLTLRGITRESRWTGTLRRDASGVHVALTTTVVWKDFEIEIPQPPFVLRFDDRGAVEVTFTAR